MSSSAAGGTGASSSSSTIRLPTQPLLSGPRSKVGAASMMQLPPSPELISMGFGPPSTTAEGNNNTNLHHHHTGVSSSSKNNTAATPFAPMTDLSLLSEDAAATILPPTRASLSASTSLLMGGTSSSCTLQQPSRLRSIAKYDAFLPRAIACSGLVQSTTEIGYSINSNVTTSGNSTSTREYSSLGAVAGDNGMAIFRISKPDVPLLVLDHAPFLPASCHLDPVRAMAFGPTTTTSSSFSNNAILLLAAARGNGVYVWDATGNSLSPLLGRLALEVSLSEPPEGDVTSLAWKPNNNNNNNSIIAMTTAMSASLWDLRTSLGSRTSRPCLKFGNVPSRAPLTQIALCSKSDFHCATMDETGAIRLHDIRMTLNHKITSTSSHSTKTNHSTCRILAEIQAFDFAGVGLASFATSRGDGLWMSWGMDIPPEAKNADAIVKVFSFEDDNNKSFQQQPAAPVDPDSYWFMDGSSERSPVSQQQQQNDDSHHHHASSAYHLVAQFSTPSLACARVCPSPFDDSIVTVGMTKSGIGIGGGYHQQGWRAELWKLAMKSVDENDNDGDEEEDDDLPSPSTSGNSFGVKKIMSFESNEPGTTSRLYSSLGKSVQQMGALQNVDLSLAVLYDEHTFVNSTMRGREGGRPKKTLELTLCGLTENGYITTHSISEVPWTKKLKAKLSDSQRTSLRPLRYMPSERHGVAAFDAASALGSSLEPTTKQTTAGIVPLLDESLRPSMATPQAEKVRNSPAPSPKKNNEAPGGPPLPFDMDSIVPSSVVGPEGVKGIDLQPTRLMVNRSAAPIIRPDKVPCPRLCGAAFSPRGLIYFRNGEVQKMWNWFQNSDPKRRSSSKTVEGKATTPGPAREQHIDRGSHTAFPRTKKDLNDMNKAAKEAQWGESNESRENSTGESDASSSILDDMFDEFGFNDGDDSLEDSDELLALESEKGEHQEDGLYEKYFSINKRNPLEVEKKVHKDGGKDFVTYEKDVVIGPREDRVHSFEGPSSDLLAPVVNLAADINEFSFDGQTIFLAENLQLGDWFAETPEDTDETGTQNAVSAPNGNVSNPEGNTPDEKFTASPVRKGLKILGSNPNIGVGSSLKSVKSDPMLTRTYDSRMDTLSTTSSMEDEAQGGEHNRVLPGRRESLKFLKKLLRNQPEGQTYERLRSPPDAPMLPRKLSIGQMPRTIAPLGVALTDPSQAAGVLTRTTSSAQLHRLVALTKMKQICQHNSDVCNEAKQPEKANTWSLLAQAVGGMMDDDSDGYSGWGTPGGGALGRDLAENIIKFYEANGDVQMVSTLVCVLSGGGRKSATEDNGRKAQSLLPVGRGATFDLFLRRYSEVLFRWGLVYKRLEVLKHLAHHRPLAHERETQAPDSGGVALDIKCPRCHESTTDGSNICSNCQDFAFRCVICDNAVRALFTVCKLCGHGGHIGCITSWFKHQTQCPSGCGCRCKQVPLQNTNEVIASLHDKPELRVGVK